LGEREVTSFRATCCPTVDAEISEMQGSAEIRSRIEERAARATELGKTVDLEMQLPC
jgi:hypothetical protein